MDPLNLSEEFAGAVGLSGQLVNLVIRLDQRYSVHQSFGGVTSLPTSHIDIYLVISPDTMVDGPVLDQVAYLLLAHPGRLHIHCGLTRGSVFHLTSPQDRSWLGWDATLASISTAQPVHNSDHPADIHLLLSHRLRYRLPRDCHLLDCDFCAGKPFVGPGSDVALSQPRSDLTLEWIKDRMSRVQMITMGELEAKEWYQPFKRDWHQSQW
ncbi:uncharacterized protein MKK02DRAFT_43899 [Dioszegia hungarica]|uniref:Uncharacterized protein n=1 Tax=Dioszegia hungarica TaxID=4972 RepID=A0AA38LU25_9TREE|nr:uncharacterized protein MKK02DRAFT_43899 [Dioszegia hungarica]KAI9635218.1 hypothetical protein MKK02DRAFT_43899 [Dioszegia hungarica]